MLASLPQAFWLKLHRKNMLHKCIPVAFHRLSCLAFRPIVRHGFAVQPHVALHASNAFAAVDQCILKGCYTCVQKHIVTEMEFHPVIHSLCGLPPCWARSWNSAAFLCSSTLCLFCFLSPCLQCWLWSAFPRTWFMLMLSKAKHVDAWYLWRTNLNHWVGFCLGQLQSLACQMASLEAQTGL